jgi:hypothetical protein
MKQTITAVAAAVKCSVTTLKKAIRAGLVEREDDGTFNLRRVRRGIEAQSARRGGQKWHNSGGMPEALVAIKQEREQEELELTRAKRMRAQQELARDAGELLIRSEWLRKWAELFMNFRDALAQVGAQIALRCDGKKAREIAEIVRAEHERILKELADGGGRLNESIGGRR